MSKTIVMVFTEQGGEQRYGIGQVAVDDTLFDSEEKLDSLLADLWTEWRGEVEFPDTDSEFIDWLVENKPGFTAVKQAVTYSVIKV